MLSERSQMQKTVYWCDSIYMKCPERTHLFIYFKDFIYLLEGKGEKERETLVQELSIGCLLHVPIWGSGQKTQALALTGNRTGDLSVCRPVLSPLSHTSQGAKGQSIETESRSLVA